jgi:hypothetical protein
VVHEDLPGTTIGTVLRQFTQGTSEAIVTTPRFIYGASWDFLPKLFVVHLPERFKAWLSILQW